MRRHSTGAPPDWPALFAELAQTARDPRLTRFYQAGTVSADTPLEQAPLLALDVETTGLDSRRDSIVSLGLVPFDLRRIRCREARYWVVKPACELSGQSVTFHHITHSDIQSAPRLDAVLDELLTAMAGKIMVVHYRPIERGFLDQAVRQLLDQQAVSIRLADSRLRYGLPPYQAHHALTDALATAELLQAQTARHYPASTAVGDLWN